MFSDTKQLLAVITICFFFAVVLTLFFVQIPPANLDLVKTFGIALISSASLVIGYYFGSSEGSARKTELMAPPPSVIGEPLVPLKSAEPATSSEAGFVNLRFLVELFLVGCMLLMLAACATTSPTAPPSAKDSPQILAGKSLLAVKSTIVVAATSIDALCKSGTMPADKCSQAKAAYETAKPAYDAAVDAYLLMSSTGGDPAEFGRTLQRVQGLAASLLSLSGGAK